VQAALKQPLEPHEFEVIRDYAQQNWQATPQTVLTTAQVQDLLNQIFVRRAEREGGVPEVRTFSRSTARCLRRSWRRSERFLRVRD
jgi:hypothetical protein